MNKCIVSLICSLFIAGCVEDISIKKTESIIEWPILRHYEGDQLARIAMPLGGIGTGTVSLNGRGGLVDWEVMNRPAKGYSTVVDGNDAPFFAVYYRTNGGNSGARALLGPIQKYEYEHMEGRPVNHHGLPRFRHASFDAAYPFGQVHLSDDNLPFTVLLKAYNPLIPGNADDSGIPVAILCYEVINQTNEDIEVSVCGSLRNFIGRDGSKTRRSWKGEAQPLGANGNKNRFIREDKASGIFMYSKEVDKESPAWGTFAISTIEEKGITYRTASKANIWNNAILDFWDDFSADGELTEKEEKPDEDDPMGSLAVKKLIPAGSTEKFTFLLTWHFPNRKAWSWDITRETEIVGNYYTTKYSDAWDVVEKVVPRLDELEEKTRLFVNSFLNSDLPDVVKEAALFNTSTLRTQTVFRIADGHMMGWEGCMDSEGSCLGSCTHVWNYEQTTPFLFGELARTMRDVEFKHALAQDGRMSFRAMLPLEIANKDRDSAADGQMGTIMKFYREWQLSGDDSFLKEYWPQVKSALSFAWIQGGWDADSDGIMEGSQHNTMDVNYFGPNPQMQFWYMGALRAASEMARYIGDDSFADKCDKLLVNARDYAGKEMFNGEYYEHIIMPPEGKTPEDLRFQLGPGCLVDQLAGQYMSHITGLGYLSDKDKIRTTLESIMKYNFRDGFYDHFNNMRSYTLGDEKGLLMASWPNGRLEVPFPYFAETMTGFEYTAATGMIYEGMENEGLRVIEAIRDRYDGRKRSPFDEAECGHHYARAMAAWAPVLALTGFEYSGVSGEMTFNAKEGQWFWSNGYGWGTVDISQSNGDWDVTLKVLYGELELKTFELASAGKISFETQLNLAEGQERRMLIE